MMARQDDLATSAEAGCLDRLCTSAFGTSASTSWKRAHARGHGGERVRACVGVAETSSDLRHTVCRPDRHALSKSRGYYTELYWACMSCHTAPLSMRILRYASPSVEGVSSRRAAQAFSCAATSNSNSAMPLTMFFAFLRSCARASWL